jgi:hypothetical protein
VLDGLSFAQILIQVLDWFDGCAFFALFYELERPKVAFLVRCWVTGLKMIIIMINGMGALSGIPWCFVFLNFFSLKMTVPQYHLLLLEYGYSPMRNYALPFRSSLRGGGRSTLQRHLDKQFINSYTVPWTHHLINNVRRLRRDYSKPC